MFVQSQQLSGIIPSSFKAVLYQCVFVISSCTEVGTWQPIWSHPELFVSQEIADKSGRSEWRFCPLRQPGTSGSTNTSGSCSQEATLVHEEWKYSYNVGTTLRGYHVRTCHTYPRFATFRHFLVLSMLSQRKNGEHW